MTTSQDPRVKEMIVDSRINKLLSMRTETASMIESLDAISEFYDRNNNMNNEDNKKNNNNIDRRLLRQNLELQNIELADKFFLEYDVIKKCVEKVEDQANNLDNACRSLASRVTDADQNMKAFMKKATELEKQRNNFNEQSSAINIFLNKFQLNEEEIGILYNSPIETENSRPSQIFFRAL